MGWSKVGVVALMATIISLSCATPMPSPMNDPKPKSDAPKGVDSKSIDWNTVDFSSLPPRRPGRDRGIDPDVLDDLVNRFQDVIGDMPLPTQEIGLTEFPKFPFTQTKVKLEQPIDKQKFRNIGEKRANMNNEDFEQELQRTITRVKEITQEALLALASGGLEIAYDTYIKHIHVLESGLRHGIIDPKKTEEQVKEEIARAPARAQALIEEAEVVEREFFSRVFQRRFSGSSEKEDSDDDPLDHVVHSGPGLVTLPIFPGSAQLSDKALQALEEPNGKSTLTVYNLEAYQYATASDKQFRAALQEQIDFQKRTQWSMLQNAVDYGCELVYREFIRTIRQYEKSLAANKLEPAEAAKWREYVQRAPARAAALLENAKKTREIYDIIKAEAKKALSINVEVPKLPEFPEPIDIMEHGVHPSAAYIEHYKKIGKTRATVSDKKFVDHLRSTGDAFKTFKIDDLALAAERGLHVSYEYFKMYINDLASKLRVGEVKDAEESQKWQLIIKRSEHRANLMIREYKVAKDILLHRLANGEELNQHLKPEPEADAPIAEGQPKGNHESFLPPWRAPATDNLLTEREMEEFQKIGFELGGLDDQGFLDKIAALRTEMRTWSIIHLQKAITHGFEVIYNAFARIVNQFASLKSAPYLDENQRMNAENFLRQTPFKADIIIKLYEGADDILHMKLDEKSRDDSADELLFEGDTLPNVPSHTISEAAKTALKNPQAAAKFIHIGRDIALGNDEWVDGYFKNAPKVRERTSLHTLQILVDYGFDLIYQSFVRFVRESTDKEVRRKAAERAQKILDQLELTKKLLNNRLAAAAKATEASPYMAMMKESDKALAISTSDFYLNIQPLMEVQDKRLRETVILSYVADLKRMYHEQPVANEEVFGIALNDAFNGWIQKSEQEGLDFRMIAERVAFNIRKKDIEAKLKGNEDEAAAEPKNVQQIKEYKDFRNLADDAFLRANRYRHARDFMAMFFMPYTRPEDLVFSADRLPGLGSRRVAEFPAYLALSTLWEYENVPNILRGIMNSEMVIKGPKEDPQSKDHVERYFYGLCNDLNTPAMALRQLPLLASSRLDFQRLVIRDNLIPDKLVSLSKTQRKLSERTCSDWINFMENFKYDRTKCPIAESVPLKDWASMDRYLQENSKWTKELQEIVERDARTKDPKEKDTSIADDKAQFEAALRMAYAYKEHGNFLTMAKGFEVLADIQKELLESMSEVLILKGMPSKLEVYFNWKASKLAQFQIMYETLYTRALASDDWGSQADIDSHVEAAYVDALKAGKDIGPPLDSEVAFLAWSEARVAIATLIRLATALPRKDIYLDEDVYRVMVDAKEALSAYGTGFYENIFVPAVQSQLEDFKNSADEAAEMLKLPPRYDLPEQEAMLRDIAWEGLSQVSGVDLRAWIYHLLELFDEFNGMATEPEAVEVAPPQEDIEIDFDAPAAATGEDKKKKKNKPKKAKLPETADLGGFFTELKDTQDPQRQPSTADAKAAITKIYKALKDKSTLQSGRKTILEAAKLHAVGESMRMRLAGVMASRKARIAQSNKDKAAYKALKDKREAEENKKERNRISSDEKNANGRIAAHTKTILSLEQEMDTIAEILALVESGGDVPVDWVQVATVALEFLDAIADYKNSETYMVDNDRADLIQEIITDVILPLISRLRSRNDIEDADLPIEVTSIAKRLEGKSGLQWKPLRHWDMEKVENGDYGDSISDELRSQILEAYEEQKAEEAARDEAEKAEIAAREAAQKALEESQALDDQQEPDAKKKKNKKKSKKKKQEYDDKTAASNLKFILVDWKHDKPQKENHLMDNRGAAERTRDRGTLALYDLVDNVRKQQQDRFDKIYATNALPLQVGNAPVIPAYKMPRQAPAEEEKEFKSDSRDFKSKQEQNDYDYHVLLHKMANQEYEKRKGKSSQTPAAGQQQQQQGQPKCYKGLCQEQKPQKTKLESAAILADALERDMQGLMRDFGIPPAEIQRINDGYADIQFVFEAAMESKNKKKKKKTGNSGAVADTGNRGSMGGSIADDMEEYRAWQQRPSRDQRSYEQWKQDEADKKKKGPK